MKYTYSSNYDINKLQSNLSQVQTDNRKEILNSLKQSSKIVSGASLIKDEKIIFIKANSAYNITLPKAIDRYENPVVLKIIEGSSNITIDTIDGEIEGSASVVLSSSGTNSLYLISDGNNYWSI